MYGDPLTEAEVNIHFKYVDNTPYDIIQHCVFVIRRNVMTGTGDMEQDEESCDWIETVCNTFLPITPRPLLERDNLRVCGDRVAVANYSLSEVTTTDSSITESSLSDAEEGADPAAGSMQGHRHSSAENKNEKDSEAELSEEVQE